MKQARQKNEWREKRRYRNVKLIIQGHATTWLPPRKIHLIVVSLLVLICRSYLLTIKHYSLQTGIFLSCVKQQLAGARNENTPIQKGNTLPLLMWFLHSVSRAYKIKKSKEIFKKKAANRQSQDVATKLGDTNILKIKASVYECQIWIVILASHFNIKRYQKRLYAWLSTLIFFKCGPLSQTAADYPGLDATKRWGNASLIDSAYKKLH